MSAADRQNKIVEMVMDQGEIKIQEICSRFGISDMTARRDLNELDRRGLLRRVHGGAVANLGRSYEPSFQTRSTKHKKEKEAIGKKAAEIIYDGDSIALDVGTTTLEIARNLGKKRNLTVITNCMQISNVLVQTLSLETEARLILTGGIVRPRELSMVGSIPEDVYQEYHVDKVFLGIGGISIENGLTEFNMEDARVKQVLLKSARSKIVVADSSKFGVTTFKKVSPIDAVEHIITDSGVSKENVEEITKLGVKVTIADT